MNLYTPVPNNKVNYKEGNRTEEKIKG